MSKIMALSGLFFIGYAIYVGESIIYIEDLKKRLLPFHSQV